MKTKSTKLSDPLTPGLRTLLNQKASKYEKARFIEDDPISIPHDYSLKQDIEISAFWTAILAWGNRKTIIKKAKELFALMDNAPFDFCKNHQEKDRQRFLGFKHRTFNFVDSCYFLEFLQFHYLKEESLENAFLVEGKCESIEGSLIHFEEYFFSLSHSPKRTRKHISTPARKSSCKRLNMFLRWMVRSSEKGVDFGIWKSINSKQLMLPLDVHVGRMARELGILERESNDWKAVEELTSKLRFLDPEDPAKYDFALFGMGIDQKKGFEIL